MQFNISDLAGTVSDLHTWWGEVHWCETDGTLLKTSKPFVNASWAARVSRSYTHVPG
jgi:hypothetical protein